jgi:hypothetical protein
MHFLLDKTLWSVIIVYRDLPLYWFDPKTTMKRTIMMPYKKKRTSRKPSDKGKGPKEKGLKVFKKIKPKVSQPQSEHYSTIQESLKGKSSKPTNIDKSTKTASKSKTNKSTKTASKSKTKLKIKK